MIIELSIARSKILKILLFKIFLNFDIKQNKLWLEVSLKDREGKIKGSALRLSLD
jgi:hypothetical protein